MAETKLLPCRRKGEHCACFEQGQQCCECGWSRPVTSDPRITSADEMAKALKDAVELITECYPRPSMDAGYWPTVKPIVERLDAALTAYNALK